MYYIIAIIIAIIFFIYINETEFFFLPIATRSTRNMSYDLRGDPFRINKRNYIWNNSSYNPINNQLII